MLGPGSLSLVFLRFFSWEDPVEQLDDLSPDTSANAPGSVTPLVDEMYGQRHFYVRDINGVLLDIIEPIALDPGWLAANGLDR